MSDVYTVTITEKSLNTFYDLLPHSINRFIIKKSIKMGSFVLGKDHGILFSMILLNK